LFGARLAAIQPTHNVAPIKSMLIDRKIAALRFSAAHHLPSTTNFPRNSARLNSATRKERL
jgi:hypothetical protein